MKGMNIRKGVRITFEEAIRGCEKELDLVIKDPCPKCNGTGAKPGTSPETCSKCGGKGSGSIYFPSHFSVQFRTSRLVRTVAEPVRS